MANEQNLTPFTSEQSREEAVKNGKKGGVNSGKARKRKADLRKMAQQVLDGTFKDKNGVEFTGEEAIIHGLVANITSPNSKNWGKAMELLIKLSGADKSREENQKLKAEVALLKAKIKQIEQIGAGIDVEDLSSLVGLLNRGDTNNDEDTDDTVETVQR